MFNFDSFLPEFGIVDLFFSGLSAEKKTYFLSAYSASRVPPIRAGMKNILSLTRIAKMGPSA